MNKKITRRQVLGLVAGAIGTGFMASGAGNVLAAAFSPKAKIAKWQGVALGGIASLQLAHESGDKAKIALKTVVSELQRLEKIFSLYDPTSAVSNLNRQGFLKTPPMELVTLLSTAQDISVLTNGAFDVTVQNLWEAEQSSSPNDDVLRNIGFERIRISSQVITLGKGQKLTLNGIAQGAITDHLTSMLKRLGFKDMIINAGEIRALGQHPNGRPWRVALGNEGGPMIALDKGAVATTKPNETSVHLFNPNTGAKGSEFARVSVVAPTATLADGLSTALAVTEGEKWQAIIAGFKDIHVNAETKAGETVIL
jgi:thiamine biosynthesis lipoprotein